MKSMRQVSRSPSQAGAGAVEFLISIPIVLLLILGSLQASLLYQARLQLEVATQEAARAGALHGGDLNEIREGLARGLTPLYTHGQGVADLAKARARAEVAARTATIEILSPTQEALADHKEFGRLPLDDKTGQALTPGGNWGWGIPESQLGYRKTALGGQSGLSIQDANLLKIRVTYHHPMIMPFIDRLFARFDAANAGHGSAVGSDAGGKGAFAGAQGLQDRLRNTFPLTAEATFRMQTPFTHLGNLQAVGNLANPQAGGSEQYNPPDAAPPADLEPLPTPEAEIPDYEGDLPPPPDFSACVH